ncbi:ArnT family glycosyltransferase [Flavihumibacter petaseus]|uniref:Glycosyltransferase RgtA/B/C/D-like domain-containing protein n=1 Tax=Flavihumibacter petaseus NBRC 106054 TaxID=1220578 RepID=A0A0E9MXL5_9BACT|nr:glycosyltransferase family 39 protein [Flavihumibacter petaseus]GAO42248.1 hypothetical protein FPE01S_01_12610 [Flavihumibacter petaseus NBRC 106054]
MTSPIKKNALSWFFGAWLLIGLLQAAFTQLLDDEAYYWVYSRFLDWGYFDHPPMIAALIKTGYTVFHNELGVRLFMVLMSTGSLMIMYRLLPVKDDILFMYLASSMAVFQIGGILAVPDIPLTFFTAVFFLQYKRFLEKDTIGNGLLLGLVMALMLYSKYHGILVIFFTFLSNPKLLLRRNAWVAAISGILLFLPHLWWQAQHGFPSVGYHLKERNAPSYRLTFSIEYVLGQLLLAGPLIGWLLFYATARKKPADLFEQSLRYTVIGFYLFFLVSTLKGRVEANWTVPALIPLMILSHAWLSGKPLSVWVKRLWLPALIAIFLLRIYLVTDISFLTNRFHDEMHHNKTWATAVQKAANGKPVVFFDSYQRPSKYWFYTGDTAFGLNTTRYRRNNYNFWPIEKSFQGRDVFLADKFLANDSGAVEIPNNREPMAGKVFNDFTSASGIDISPSQGKLYIRKGRLEDFVAVIKGETGSETYVLDIFEGDDPMVRLPLKHQKKADGSFSFSSDTDMNISPGKYRAKIGVWSGIPGIASQNSRALEIIIN